MINVKPLFFFVAVNSIGYAAEQLIILSPHRKSIQTEYVGAFRDYYRKSFKMAVKVDWLDQGGTSDDVRFLKSKFANNKNSAGIDIFWGGGTSTFLDLKNQGFLDKHSLSKELQIQIPQDIAGVPLYDNSLTWYASAISSFGIFFNKKVLKLEKIAEPKTWADLTKPEFKDQLSLTDPRRSGTAAIMNQVVLQSVGWDKGWEMLTLIAANTRSFTHSSSDPIKAVVSGDASAAMAIDFYALAKIGDLGKDNLGFQIPTEQSVLDPDPIAILKGAPNRNVAERFVNYILGVDAQKILVLPKGEKDGPKYSTLGRMAVNKEVYRQTQGRRVFDLNPFEQKSFFKLDLEKTAKLQEFLNDYIGATLIDVHSDLKAAWTTVIKRGSKSDDIQALAKSLISEKEALELASKWHDNVFRNKQINEWTNIARKKFNALKK